MASHYLTTRNRYQSPGRPLSWYLRRNVTPAFYAQMAWIVWYASRLAKRGDYTDQNWTRSSLSTINALESVGGNFHFENLDVIRTIEPPCVLIGNHMSVLETFILPCLVKPYFDVTFIIKESLMAYPFFRHVMQSRNPIVVGRTNPRKDLGTVLKEGAKKLSLGTSVIVFPQTTRSFDFDRKKFNTLGVKLAGRAHVPVIPIALKTDAWGMGRRFKDLGRIRPEKTVHIHFGDPFKIKGSGKREHNQISDFIESKLRLWKKEEADKAQTK